MRLVNVGVVGRGARDKGRIQGREERIGDAVALKPKVFPFVVALLLGSVTALLGPLGPSQRDREIKKRDRKSRQKNSRLLLP